MLKDEYPESEDEDDGANCFESNETDENTDGGLEGIAHEWATRNSFG